MTDEFNCCKRCSIYGQQHTWAEVKASYQDFIGQNFAVREYFLTKDRFEDFVIEWMQMPYDSRKNLSYYGGLTRNQNLKVPQKSSGEREHSADIESFDPGNWSYYKGMEGLSPGLLRIHGWNQETVGDIWEGILGYRFLHRNNPEANEDVLALAALVDSYMNSLHVFVVRATAVKADFWSLQFDQWAGFVDHGPEPDCTVVKNDIARLSHDLTSLNNVFALLHIAS